MFIHASGSSFLILVFGFRIRIGKKYMYKRRNILGFQICTLTMFFSEGTDSHRDENMYNRYPARDNTYQHI